MKKCCVVIGMGRSGTSMLSAMLNILGVEFGKNLHGPNKYNPHGHFENSFLTDTNDALVHILSGKPPAPQWSRRGPPARWLYPRQFQTGWLQSIPLNTKNRIKSMLKTSIEQYQFFGMKDPRITLLLPLYMQILEELNVRPYLISIKRNGESVAKSLYKFHNFCMPHDQAIQTWKHYNNEVEKYSNLYQVHQTEYEKILESPIDHSRQLSEFLHLEFTPEKETAIQNLVDNKLNHN